MRRIEEVPGKNAAAALLVATAAGALAIRPLVVTAYLPPVDVQTWTLATLYLSIAVASLLPRLRHEAAKIRPAVVFLVGSGALVLAWSTAGPVAPLGLSSATIPLSLLAAVAEEALFRRLAYGRLRRFGIPTAIGGAALLFALVHVPAYGVAAFPVDLGAGLLFGWQRWASGIWTVPAATHAVANLLAVIR
jgi:membrane protease YdiL (CAAX protease family)